MSQSDPNLTDLGVRQARAVAERLASDPIPTDELIVSPLVRALETAEPISRALGLEPEIVDDLREMELPDWSGTPEERVQEIFQDSRHRSPEEWWDGWPGGESFHDFHSRVTVAVTDLLAARSIIPRNDGSGHLWKVGSAPGRVAIVAHGGTNSVALSFLLGSEPTPWEWERFVLNHASIARIKAVSLAGAHVFSLRSFNDVGHMQPDERTR